jgi:hypothetical protein
LLRVRSVHVTCVVCAAFFLRFFIFV